MTREEKLEALLKKIVLRAHRPEKMGSTEQYVQKVPAPLIEEAAKLLDITI
jgi:hypothetical protein